VAGRLFFTSDTHFGDPNVLRIRKRPFASVGDMDELLINNWNETVAPDDTVYHLGDFSHRTCFEAADYIRKLNGRLHLVRGNHDDVLVEVAGGLFESVSLMEEVDWQGWRFVLLHYPMRDWANAVRGACHLYGHVHGRLDDHPIGRSLDVGVESHDYRPVSVEAVVSILEDRPQHSRGTPPML